MDKRAIEQLKSEEELQSFARSQIECALRARLKQSEGWEDEWSKAIACIGLFLDGPDHFGNAGSLLRKTCDFIEDETKGKKVFYQNPSGKPAKKREWHEIQFLRLKVGDLCRARVKLRGDDDPRYETSNREAARALTNSGLPTKTTEMRTAYSKRSELDPRTYSALEACKVPDYYTPQMVQDALDNALNLGIY